MDDLISKQQAINAINEIIRMEHSLRPKVYVAKDAIKQLPSAQPEIVRCKDCKYAEYIDDVKTLWCTECGQGRTVAPYDFCSYAEKKEVTT